MRAQRGSWRRDAAPQMRTGPAGPVVWSAGPLRRLERLEVHGGLLAVAAALEVEADLLALIEGGHAGALDGRDMDKRILAAIGRLDETVTLGGNEEFDAAFGPPPPRAGRWRRGRACWDRPVGRSPRIRSAGRSPCASSTSTCARPARAAATTPRTPPGIAARSCRRWTRRWSRRSGPSTGFHVVAEVAVAIAGHAGGGALEGEAEFVGHGEVAVADQQLAEVAGADRSLISA